MIGSGSLLIIPAPHGDLRESIELNQPLIAWVKQRHKQGTEVASLCLGAFLLAATGLLRGRQCATHWIAAHEFRQLYPDVELVDERVITDELALYSSGGAYSYLNLVLYLIEKYVGREMAVCCAKVFQVDIGRGSQSPFVIFQGLKAHEDQPIRKAQEFIEADFQQKISVDELAETAALSRRNFERRFKKSTFNTVAEYIQRVKIEAAKMSLESSRDNVNEIMYSVGYSDTKAFRTLFKKLTRVSPVAYRDRYSRKEAAWARRTTSGQRCLATATYNIFLYYTAAKRSASSCGVVLIAAGGFFSKHWLVKPSNRGSRSANLTLLTSLFFPMRYLLLLPLALLLGCAATDQAAVESPVTNTSYLSVNRAFDVPSLLGLKANEIDRPLTTASVTPNRDLTPRQESSGATESMYTYWRDTTALVVSFDPATQRVNSFFVKTKSGLTSDYNTLLRLVGVSRFDKRMTIEPMASVSNPQYYTGVKLVPVQQ